MSISPLQTSNFFCSALFKEAFINSRAALVPTNAFIKVKNGAGSLCSAFPSSTKKYSPASWEKYEVLQHCGLESQFRNFRVSVQNQKNKKKKGGNKALGSSVPIPEVLGERSGFCLRFHLQGLAPDPLRVFPKPQIPPLGVPAMPEELLHLCPLELLLFPSKPSALSRNSPGRGREEPSSHTEPPGWAEEPLQSTVGLMGSQGTGKKSRPHSEGVNSPSTLQLLLTLSLAQIAISWGWEITAPRKVNKNSIQIKVLSAWQCRGIIGSVLWQLMQ